MNINKSELEAVAVKPNQYPPEGVAEIAFAGRSNVGKSSLLNLLTGRKKLARVSGSPGKTRTINFYRVNDAFRIVDLPGYGYAKVSKSVSEGWGEMMERYLEQRESLRKVIQLVDIRHQPSKQDVQMYEYLNDIRHDPSANDKMMYEWMVYQGFHPIIVATKMDKIKRSQLQKQIKLIRQTLKLSAEDVVIPVSALKKTGYEELLDVMEEILED